MAPLTTTPIQEEFKLLVHAYLDGELDAASVLAIEQRINADPVLANGATNITALQKVLREKFPPQPMPAYLKSRIDAAIGKKSVRARPTWMLMAASVLVSIALSSGSTWLALQTPATNVLVEELLDSHMRALTAPQPIDVASSDRHTVKPWFNGKIPQSPRVVDLAAQGYPLLGGRIDVIGKTAVPALVYGKDRHVLSVTSVLSADGGKSLSSAESVNGYNIVSWHDGDLTYWAVSDLGMNDLNMFAKLFQKPS
jgi:anti-sigma factor RsiW